MNLWLSSHFLVAGLFLSSWALTPEECQPLVTPLSLADPSMLYGRWNLIAGYTDNDVYNAMLKMTQSFWMNITSSPSSPDEVVMTQKNKMNGTCVASTINITIDGNTASGSLANIISVFHMLPSCDGCLVMNMNNTIKNLNLLKLNSNNTKEKINIHALYVTGTESTVKDSDLERFKQQASCLGYFREPDFLYDSKNNFCGEDEGIKMTF